MSKKSNTSDADRLLLEIKEKIKEAFLKSDSNFIAVFPWIKYKDLDTHKFSTLSNFNHVYICNMAIMLKDNEAIYRDTMLSPIVVSPKDSVSSIMSRINNRLSK